MTQAEELAYWIGFDEGRDRDGIMGSHNRFHDQGLTEAYERGFSDGDKDRRGKDWSFPQNVAFGPQENYYDALNRLEKGLAGE